MEQAQIPFGMLLQKAVKIRTHILEMLAEAKSGHPGGSLSAVEILVSLYFYKMRHDPKRPDWPDRDRFVLSKGHAAPVLFATLAEAGYIPVSELKTLRKLNSRLQGHPDYRVPGVEFPGGSLGLGLSAIESTRCWEMGNWTRARHGRRPWRLRNSNWGILRLSLIEMEYSKMV